MLTTTQAQPADALVLVNTPETAETSNPSRKHRTRRRVAGAAVFLLLVLGAIGLESNAAGASHGGYWNTVHGTTERSAQACVWTGTGSTCVRTNGYGQFSINVEGGHWYQFYVLKQVGCTMHYGYFNNGNWVWIQNRQNGWTTLNSQFWATSSYRVC